MDARHKLVSLFRAGADHCYLVWISRLFETVISPPSIGMNYRTRFHSLSNKTKQTLAPARESDAKASGGGQPPDSQGFPALSEFVREHKWRQNGKTTIGVAALWERWRPAQWGVVADAGLSGRRRHSCRRAQSFWGLGCPKMYHEHGDTLSAETSLRCFNRMRPMPRPFFSAATTTMDFFSIPRPRLPSSEPPM